MAFRFRKSVKLLPGVRVNFGLKGASLSVGPRGASVSLGKNGAYSNFSIPGTGISFREKIGSSSSQQKRLEERYSKAQLKLEQEQVRREALSEVNVRLNDEGILSFQNKHGELLSKKDIGLAWKQNGEALTALLQEKADELNGDIELLSMIHTDIPNPDSTPEYQYREFLVPMPTKPIKPIVTKQPLKSSVQKPSFFLMFFKKYKNRYELELQQAEEQYQKVKRKWEEQQEADDKQYENDLTAYQTKLADWEKSKEEHDKTESKQAELFDSLIETDKTTMEHTLDNVLQSLEWPRETLVNYMISDALDELWIDVDLPEIEDLPNRIATISTSGNKLSIKEKTQKQLRLEYAEHIHGIALRLAGYAFASLPSVRKVIISGYSQRLNTASGNTEDEYLYSVKIDRDNFRGLNHNDLTKVDPVASFDIFDAVRKMTATGIMHAIVPYSNS